MKRKVILIRSLMLFLVMLFSVQIMAQERSITGTVRDAANGEALPGATIVIQGSSSGTATNYEGQYEIQASTGDILVVSFVGYLNQEIVVSDLSSYDITLNPSSLEVDELVVIGYGKVKKSDATGSITSVSAKDFNKGAITSAQELLVGKSPGVSIITNGGAPGTGATIRIRGGSSLNASNDPLVIVDGVPLDNSNVSGSSNFLAFVNPNDIESVSILKDASATAIYGSRASNGVIMITTKKGKAGAPMRISYNGNTSMAKPIEFMNVFTGDSLRSLAQGKDDFFAAAAIDELGAENTDWQEEIFRTAVSQDHNLAVSGSYRSLPYRASIGYTDQNGIMKNTDLQRITGSLSLNPSFLEDDLKVSINVKATNTHQNFADAGALGSAVSMDPTRPIHDTIIDGTPRYFQWENYGASLGTPNPVEQLMEIDNRSVANRAVANVQIDYALPFLEGLHANLNVAKDMSKSSGHNNRPTTSPASLTGQYWGRISNYSADFSNDLIDFYLNYTTEFGDDHNLDLTAGYSWQHFLRAGDSFTEGYTDIDHPYTPPDSSDFISENYLVSFFGRANYSLKNKYLATATLRADGSSRFAKGNQWGLFPSVALAWKINREDFMENIGIFTDLKLRASWGVTGQQDIGGDYPAQALFITSSPGAYYMFGGEWIPTLRPDPYDLFIKWEETTTQNIALDFGFFKNRLTGTIEAYHRVTNDLLNNVNVASGSNFSNNLTTNVGNMEIDGLELSLEMIPISTKDMNLTFGMNATYNSIEVTRLLLTDDPTYLGILSGNSFTGFNQITAVGSSRNAFFLNKQVYDENDNPIEGIYVDKDGSGGDVAGVNDDKFITHKPDPDFMFGFSTRFSYKGFELSASARAFVGNYVLNMVKAGSSFNQMYTIGYWKNFNTALADYQFVERQFTSDYFLENASFLKVDNISAGYTFSNIADKMSARVSLTVQNALTVTKYSGIDPEVSGGRDSNFYPRPRTFMLGVSLTY